MISHEQETFLGFDLSTQKLKAVQLSNTLEVLAQAEVKFDSDLQGFRTFGGVNAGTQKQEFFVQPVMWVKALDMVLDRLVVQGADLSTVAALSGAAQQHGSVYWSRHGVQILGNLDPDKFLHMQIDDSAFTLTRTPIWMDGTTTKQCHEMEEAIGGRDQMVQLTGSKCYERFTGPQIRKIFQQRPDVYEHTERISLVSSFLASIFLGAVAPIDYSDGSGMNLLDIVKKTWSQECINSCAPDLEPRLGELRSSTEVLGDIAPFFVQRFNFSTNCKVVAFTGDNPSALTGMVVDRDWLVLSLGTSDTVMMTLDEPPKFEEGHVFIHPTDTKSYMGMLCFRNGSLVRDKFKHAEGNNSWDYFSELLESMPRGNFGNMALHFVNQEIIPNVKGTLRWNKDSSSSNPEAAKGVAKFSSPQTEIRALIEGQMLHRRAIASDMGFLFGENTRILATGGASANKAILQVMADVFNAPVYVQSATEAALLGAAYRAKYAMYLQDDETRKLDPENIESYYSFFQRLLPHHVQCVCEPSRDSHEIYTKMLTRWREMITVLMTQQQD
ncbi:xylulose kinase [Lutzomyia longipalpis]|nr:xylulose kinase [Lutzomyia longipalpis]